MATHVQYNKEDNKNLTVGTDNSVGGTTRSFVVGANNSVTSSNNAGVFGNNNTVSSGGAFSIGNNNESLAPFAVAIGRSARASHQAQIAIADFPFSIAGDAQTSILVARIVTTDDTPTRLRLDGASLPFFSQNNRSYAIVATYVSREVGAVNAYSGLIHALVSRGVGAGTLTVQHNNIVSEGGPLGASAAIGADTTTGEIYLEATGAPATTIRWVAKLEITEVGV